MQRLPFITFEGSEGCGKSTQVKRLAVRLKKLGVPFLLTREPGGTPIGESIRELLQFAPQSAEMTAKTELLLFEASRSQLVEEVIKPALQRNECVISDRFFDSTTVYQGAARKLDRRTVMSLNTVAVGDCVPGDEDAEGSKEACEHDEQDTREHAQEACESGAQPRQENQGGPLMPVQESAPVVAFPGRAR